MTPEGLARLFHETYERLAPEHGYKTREASAVPWADVPEANKSLMIAVASEVGAEHEGQVLRAAAKAAWEERIARLVEERIREQFGPMIARLTEEEIAKRATLIETATRAKVAEDLRRAAAGRRDYASRAPEHIAAELEAEALRYETAARVAEDPRDVMWGLLPADMWTDADRPAADSARGEA